MRQQPVTRYPIRNPLPFPVEQFVVRRGELAAWVAEVAHGDAGSGAVLAGHVSALAVDDDELGRAWSAAAGRPVEELAAVSVLVVDVDLGRRGIGSHLLDVCESHILGRGRTPVLEVAAGAHAPAAGLYLARGWRVGGELRPAWLPASEPPVQLMLHPDRG